MSRKHGSTRVGLSFSALIKLMVWNKGIPVARYSPALVRKDRYGKLMRWDRHGITVKNGYGWEIDHIHPVAHGGSDSIVNLQPLQWENNRAKADRILA